MQYCLCSARGSRKTLSRFGVRRKALGIPKNFAFHYLRAASANRTRGALAPGVGVHSRSFEFFGRLNGLAQILDFTPSLLASSTQTAEGRDPSTATL
eukprot:9006702-Pyramimonas_sp.AAC.1